MIRAFVLIVLLIGASPVLAAASQGPAAPNVVASIRPVEVIAAAVMNGVGQPQLLLGNAASLHAHAMKPSEARLLTQADVVFWIGPSLEAFLAKPLASLAGKSRVVALMDAPGVESLSVRAGGLWSDDVPTTAAPPLTGLNLPDGHIWLDPRNAVAMANAMAETLAVVDPVNAERYWANAETFSREAMALDRALHMRLAPVREKPFLVFHDAFQYFEARYRLAAIGSIGVTPEQPPGARRLSAIQQRMREGGAVCIFSEPQFEPKIVQMLLEGTGTRTGMLDAEGVSLGDGSSSYATLMNGLADELVRCLG